MAATKPNGTRNEHAASIAPRNQSAIVLGAQRRDSAKRIITADFLKVVPFMNLPNNYGPIGACIYCDPGEITEIDELTDEHIVADGLGGKIMLLKSSCLKCNEITSKAELFVLRKMLRTSRAKLGIKSKKRHKPSKEPFVVSVHIDGQLREIQLPIENMPSLLSMVAFVEPPGLLIGADPLNDRIGIRLAYANIFYDISNNLQAIGGSALITDPMYCNYFCQMLAKIAHSFAVAVLGYGSFSPYLPKIIKGLQWPPFYYIGGFGDDGGPGTSGSIDANSNTLHELQLTETDVNGKLVIGVLIQLFAMYSMPKYHVLIGETHLRNEQTEPTSCP